MLTLIFQKYSPPPPKKSDFVKSKHVLVSESLSWFFPSVFS